MSEPKISYKAFAGRILHFCDELAHTSLSVPAGFVFFIINYEFFLL